MFSVFFCLMSADLQFKPFAAHGAFDGVFTFLARQAQNAVAAFTASKNMGFSLTPFLPMKFEKTLDMRNMVFVARVFFSALGEVAGHHAEQRVAGQHEYGKPDEIYEPESDEDAGDEKNDLQNRKKSTQLVHAVSAVPKASDPLTEGWFMMMVMTHFESASNDTAIDDSTDF